jgi:hypothetical protein
MLVLSKEHSKKLELMERSHPFQTAHLLLYVDPHNRKPMVQGVETKHPKESDQKSKKTYWNNLKAAII